MNLLAFQLFLRYCTFAYR